MRTQDWRAPNAPNGPSAVVKCPDCSKGIFSLKQGRSISLKGKGDLVEKTCDCGCSIKIRIIENER